MPNFHSNCFEGEGSTCALLFSLTVPTTCFIRLYATPLCSVPNSDRNCRDTADDWPAPPRITIGQDGPRHAVDDWLLFPSITLLTFPACQSLTVV